MTGRAFPSDPRPRLKPRQEAEPADTGGMDFVAYARNLVARIAQSGWRPVFGWGGGLMLLNALHFAYIEAPRLGIVLTDGYYTGLNIALAAFLGAFVARGIEKAAERHQGSPTGGLVNRAAVS